MLLAKETIYIHDWWLSPGDLFSFLLEFSDADWLIFPSNFVPPLSWHAVVELIFPNSYGKTLHSIELQMRRPNKDKYRLDRLLERKAKEGVKIYVIL